MDKLQLQDIKEEFIRDNGDIEEPCITLLLQFVRDIEQDIIYNPNNADTTLKNSILFYFVDYKNNVFYAYNRNLLDVDIINKYKYKDDYGCLCFLSNCKNSISYNNKDVNFTRLFTVLIDKVGYGFGTLLYGT